MKLLATTVAVFGMATIFALSGGAAQAATKLPKDQKINLVINARSNRQEIQQPASDSDKKIQLASKHKSSQKAKPSKSETVTVKRGDNLSKLAKHHDSTALRMFYANKKISNPDLIYPGEDLKVPAKNAKLTPRPVPQNTVTVMAPQPTHPIASTPEVKPEVASAPETSQTNYATSSDQVSGGIWDSIAACESGGNWHINTDNGFYGGLQFTLSSWQAVGGSGLPSNASKAEQISRAKILQSEQGWGAWPVCSVKAGI